MVPVACAVGAMSIIATIVFLLSFGALFSLVFHVMKTSGGYQEALAAARANPAVVQALGTPIKDGLLPTGDVGATYSNLEIPIHGPKGEGTLHVSATKSMGQWTFTGLVVEVKGTGERIDLLAESTS